MAGASDDGNVFVDLARGITDADDTAVSTSLHFVEVKGSIDGDGLPVFLGDTTAMVLLAEVDRVDTVGRTGGGDDVALPRFVERLAQPRQGIQDCCVEE